MKKFTVIGYYEQGDDFVDHVEADDAEGAIGKVQEDRDPERLDDIYVLAVLAGHHSDVRGD